MTISGWTIFAVTAVIIAGVAFSIYTGVHNKKFGATVCIIAVVLIVALFCGMWWYFHCTAAGQREMVDQRSELSSGLDRTITVYTADGNVIAQYEGKIDIETNDGGYVKFDFNGKRYIYYNCFVESIASIN